MPSQIILAWTVDVAGSSIGPAGAATILAGVPLYANPVTDPVLGQLFGLTVASDATTTSSSTATRTLTLNMTAAHDPPAPPPFPCHPDTSGPPTLPYPLVKSVRLPGSLTPVTGQSVIPTTDSLIPSLDGTPSIQFDCQLGVYYPVSSVSQSAVTLSTPYTGKSGPTRATKQVAAPVKRLAVYSTSPLDTSAVSGTVPAVPAGSGARTVSLSYMDSTGAGPFTVTVTLTGKRPAPVTLAGGSVDVATVTALKVASTGAFGNSVGQLTLACLTGAVATFPPTTPIGTYLGQITDQAQLLLGQAVAYLPISYSALSQQGAAARALPATCLVTTGSIAVPTDADLTSLVTTGSFVQFAVQPDEDTPSGRIVTVYEVGQCTPKLLTLRTPFTGMGPKNALPNPGTLGTKSTQVQDMPTAATLFPPSASIPTDAQLAALLGEFSNPGVAGPPPNPPLQPTGTPPPTILSGMFGRTLQLALAVPVVAQPIAFA